MRSFRVEQAYEGDYITPHEFNAELAEISDSFHGLDRDNVDNATLGHLKVALDAWNVFEYAERTTTRQTTHGESQSKATLAPVPDEAGTGTFGLDITTGDGALEIGGSIGYGVNGGLQLSVIVYIKVDGAVVAEAPLDVVHELGAPLVDAVHFVAPGQHRVELWYALHQVGWFGSTITVDWLPGVIWARGVVR